jgi:hypothetical protein
MKLSIRNINTFMASLASSSIAFVRRFLLFFRKAAISDAGLALYQGTTVEAAEKLPIRQKTCLRG